MRRRKKTKFVRKFFVFLAEEKGIVSEKVLKALQ